jgi:hypothetical protein
MPSKISKMLLLKDVVAAAENAAEQSVSTTPSVGQRRVAKSRQGEQDIVSALNKNTEAMKMNAEATHTQTSNATAIANTTNSSQVNNFNHSSSSGDFRRKARTTYSPYGYGYGF